jgi:hypothetical protein
MSIENIPMSTLISDLNDINIVNNEEIYEDNLSKDDLNDIINNQSILDNNFINYLITNCNLEKQHDNPSVHVLMFYYLKNMYNEVLPQDCRNKYLITLVRIIHIIGIIFMMVGCILPKSLLTYHIIFCLKALILWDIFDDKCYMSLVIQKIAGHDSYHEFIPANMSVCKICVLFVMFISIFGIAFPTLSLFNVLITILDYLKIYK